jgi:hypothetical protein
VVEGKSEKAKQTPQRVAADTIDFIRPAAYRQLAVAAKGALTPALEGNRRPVEVGVRLAMSAVKRGSREDPGYQTPVAARNIMPALSTMHLLLTAA